MRKIITVRFAKKCLLILAMVIGVSGLFLYVQWNTDGLIATSLDEQELTLSDVEKSIMFTSKSSQEFHVIVRRRILGDEKLTTSWMTIAKNDAPYRVANIRLIVEGGPFSYTLAGDGHEQSEEYWDPEDQLSHAFSAVIRDDDTQIIFQCVPAELRGHTGKIKWIFDVERDNFLGWTVCKDEVVEFDVVW